MITIKYDICVEYNDYDKNGTKNSYYHNYTKGKRYSSAAIKSLACTIWKEQEGNFGILFEAKKEYLIVYLFQINTQKPKGILEKRKPELIETYFIYPDKSIFKNSISKKLEQNSSEIERLSSYKQLNTYKEIKDNEFVKAISFLFPKYYIDYYGAVHTIAIFNDVLNYCNVIDYPKEYIYDCEKFKNYPMQEETVVKQKEKLYFYTIVTEKKKSTIQIYYQNKNEIIETMRIYLDQTNLYILRKNNFSEFVFTDHISPWIVENINCFLFSQNIFENSFLKYTKEIKKYLNEENLILYFYLLVKGNKITESINAGDIETIKKVLLLPINYQAIKELQQKKYKNDYNYFLKYQDLKK